MYSIYWSYCRSSVLQDIYVHQNVSIKPNRWFKWTPWTPQVYHEHISTYQVARCPAGRVWTWAMSSMSKVEFQTSGDSAINGVWKQWLVGGWTTHLKNISQIGWFPQVGLKIKNVWNHRPDDVSMVVIMDLPILFNSKYFQHLRTTCSKRCKFRMLPGDIRTPKGVGPVKKQI